MKEYKSYIIVLLLGVCIYCVFRYLGALQDRNKALVELNNAKSQVIGLQNEKQNLVQLLGKEKKDNLDLMQRYSLLKNNYRAGAKRISRLFAAADNLQSQIVSLKALQEEDNRLRLELAQVTHERDDLVSRFTSLTELKKAIREIKKNRKLYRTTEDNSQLTEGNSGYIIKDGKPFNSPKIRIEVNPVAATT